MSVTIAFMTNYTLDIPNTEKQKQTIESFYNNLKKKKKIETFIFYDEKPLSKIEGKITLFNNDSKFLLDTKDNLPISRILNL